MNHRNRTASFARTALLCTLSLTAACATTDPLDKVGPLAPGIGFETVAPAPVEPVTTPPVQLPSPAAEPAPTPAHAPVASRIKHHHRHVNVRPEPSSEKRPVAVLQGGKRVEVVGEQGNWVKIRWSRGKKEHEGWVFKKYVEGYE